MKQLSIFLVFLSVIVFISILEYNILLNNNKNKIQPIENTVLLNNKNRIRCPPTIKNTPKCGNIKLYNENNIIYNNGFVNEIIYKPQQNLSELQFNNQLLDNNMFLNMSELQDDLQNNLPMKNINTYYLIKNNIDIL